MNRRFLLPGLVAVGLCLIGLGMAWDRLVPSSAYWSPVQAEEYTAAQIDMHAKSHQHDANAEKNMAIARERFDKISQQLEHARGSRKRLGMLLLTAGITFLLAGIGLHLSSNRSE